MLLSALVMVAPLLIGCGVRVWRRQGGKGAVLAVGLAELAIPAVRLLDWTIHRDVGPARVGWGFAIFYGLLTGMAGLVLAELINERRDRRERGREWQQQVDRPPSEPVDP